MAARSLQDQVDSLLSQTVAEDRQHGFQSVDLETAALLQNFASTFLMNPKISLAFAFMARNKALKAVTDEIAALDALTKTISDLGNSTYAIKSSASLERAKASLLQLENQAISQVGPAYTNFDKAVSEFLTKQISKNVRRHGSTELVRPGNEARQDLPTDYSSLLSLHGELLDRLYSLLVGVENFQSAPLSSVVGTSVCYRAREDVQGIIDEISVDKSGTQSRDYATRLIGSRAAVKSLVNPPKISDPPISTSKSLPAGYKLTARTAVLPATKTFGPGPFATSGDLHITVDGTTESMTPVLGAGPTLVGAAGISWPVTIKGNTHLFFHTEEVVGGVVVSHDLRAQLNSDSADKVMTLAEIITAIEGAGLSAGEFGQPGSGRLMVWAPTASALAVNTSWTGPGLVGVPDVVIDIPIFYTNSAHEVVGLSLLPGVVGATAEMVSDCINMGFTKVSAAVSSSTVTVSTIAYSYGTTMTVSGTLADAWGFSTDSPFFPTSSSLELVGTTPDGSLPRPSELLSPGDVLTTTSGDATVVAVTTTSVIVAESLKTFSGPVEAESGLYRSWSALDSALQTFMTTWQDSPFMTGLGRLDSYIAVLAGSPTPTQRAQALDYMEKLTLWLEAVLASLTVDLPAGWGLQERAIADDLASTLIERKYDKAADYLMSCKLVEFFDLDYQSMSYGGSLMQASSNLARYDLRFPNRAKDEGERVTSSNAGGAP